MPEQSDLRPANFSPLLLGNLTAWMSRLPCVLMGLLLEMQAHIRRGQQAWPPKPHQRAKKLLPLSLELEKTGQDSMLKNGMCF